MLRLAAALAAGALLAGLASAATVTGTPGADHLKGTPRADVLDGRAGKDTLLGLTGADVLVGGPGRDTIAAGKGDDRIPAHGDGTRDRVACGPGRDIVTADASDVVQRDCEVVSRQISFDRTVDPDGQHATEVEPDSFAFGSTVVAVFQAGRIRGGGAVAIGYATSSDAGATWRSGLLPGVTRASPQRGVAERASDPVIAYDELHRVWLAATLGLSSATNSSHLYVSRSVEGRTWKAPVSAVQEPGEGLDKEWIVCDNGVASLFRGRCYLTYIRVSPWQMLTVSSDDGGLTWSAPVPTSPPPENGRHFQGAQPVVQPDGTLVVAYTSFAERDSAFENEIVASRSDDGGGSFSGPVRVALLSNASIPAIRTFSLSSAEVDAGGRIYVTWEGCPGGGSCLASRIVMSTSADGVTWAPAQAVTTASQAVDHFLPGIGANPAAAGRLALVYHSIPDDCANVPGCAGIDVFHTTSRDGGRTWSKQQRLTAESIALDSIARTRLGLMLADYVSTSFVRGRPVSVFVLASARVNGRFRQATFAYR